jgi:GMP synthase-like glutamine amidotransferase
VGSRLAAILVAIVTDLSASSVAPEHPTRDHDHAMANPRVLLVGLWVDRDPEGDVPPRFRHLPELFAAEGFDLRTIHRSELDTSPWIAEPPAGIILSGSKHNLGEDCTVADFPMVDRLLSGLPAVPLLGICFGHQFLAAHNGGRLGYAPEFREDAEWPVTPTARLDLFAGLPQPCPLAENHGMRVEDPGPGYEVIAASPDGIEAMAHRDLPRIGVQFHPEYYPRQRVHHGERFLRNWLAAEVRPRA